MTKQLGVNEILRSKKVKQMRSVSKLFDAFVKRLCSLDAEIKANNKLIFTDKVQAIILTSENDYLKRIKLQIKRVIIATIADYEKNPNVWIIKNYHADNTKEVSIDNKQSSMLCTSQGLIPETTADKKNKKQKKSRTRQCRRRNTGRSQRHC
ncbi:MAG: hypothetical protein QM490_02200 [Candidatus Gracilibacteria bacterium]